MLNTRSHVLITLIGSLVNRLIENCIVSIETYVIFKKYDLFYHHLNLEFQIEPGQYAPAAV